MATGKRVSTKRAAANSEPNNITGLTALYGGVLQKIGAVEEGNTALATKLMAILAGGLVVLTFVITAIADPKNGWQVLSTLGIGSIVVSIIACLVGLHPTDHASSTVDIRDAKFNDYRFKPDRQLLEQLIVDAEGAKDKLKSGNKRAAGAYQIAVWLFIIGTGICLTSLFVSTPKIKDIGANIYGRYHSATAHSHPKPTVTTPSKRH